MPFCILLIGFSPNLNSFKTLELNFCIVQIIIVSAFTDNCSVPPGKFTFMNGEVVITTSGVFKSLQLEQDDKIPFLHNFLNYIHKIMNKERTLWYFVHAT